MGKSTLLLLSGILGATNFVDGNNLDWIHNCPSVNAQLSEPVFRFHTDPGKWYATHCSKHSAGSWAACKYAADKGQDADTNKMFIKFPNMFTDKRAEAEMVANPSNPDYASVAAIEKLVDSVGLPANLNWHESSSEPFYKVTANSQFQSAYTVSSNGVLLKFSSGQPIVTDGSCENRTNEEACYAPVAKTCTKTSEECWKDCCIGRRYAWAVGSSVRTNSSTVTSTQQSTSLWKLTAYTSKYISNVGTRFGYSACETKVKARSAGGAQQQPECCSFSIEILDNEDPGLRYRPHGPDQKLTRCKDVSTQRNCHYDVRVATETSDRVQKAYPVCGSCDTITGSIASNPKTILEAERFDNASQCQGVSCATAVFKARKERTCFKISACSGEQYQTASAVQTLMAEADVNKHGQVRDADIGSIVLMDKSSFDKCEANIKYQPTCQNLQQCSRPGEWSYEFAQPGTCRGSQVYDKKTGKWTCPFRLSSNCSGGYPNPAHAADPNNEPICKGTGAWTGTGAGPQFRVLQQQDVSAEGCVDKAYDHFTVDRKCACVTHGTCTDNADEKFYCQTSEKATASHDARFRCSYSSLKLHAGDANPRQLNFLGTWTNTDLDGDAYGIAANFVQKQCTYQCVECATCPRGTYQDAPCLYANEPNASARMWNEDQKETVQKLYASVSRRPQHGGSGRPYCGNAIDLPYVDSSDLRDYRSQTSSYFNFQNTLDPTALNALNDQFADFFTKAQWKSYSVGTQYYLQIAQILPTRKHISEQLNNQKYGDAYYPQQFPNNGSYQSGQVDHDFYLQWNDLRTGNDFTDNCRDTGSGEYDIGHYDVTTVAGGTERRPCRSTPSWWQNNQSTGYNKDSPDLQGIGQVFFNTRGSLSNLETGANEITNGIRQIGDLKVGEHTKSDGSKIAHSERNVQEKICRVDVNSGYVTCFFGCDVDTRCISINDCKCDEYQIAAPTYFTQRICHHYAAINGDADYVRDYPTLTMDNHIHTVTNVNCYGRRDDKALKVPIDSQDKTCRDSWCGTSCGDYNDYAKGPDNVDTVMVQPAMLDDEFCQFFDMRETPIRGICTQGTINARNEAAYNVYEKQEINSTNVAARAAANQWFLDNSNKVRDASGTRYVFSGAHQLKAATTCDMKTEHLKTRAKAGQWGVVDTECAPLTKCGATFTFGSNNVQASQGGYVVHRDQTRTVTDANGVVVTKGTVTDGYSHGQNKCTKHMMWLDDHECMCKTQCGSGTTQGTAANDTNAGDCQCQARHYSMFKAVASLSQLTTASQCTQTCDAWTVCDATQYIDPANPGNATHDRKCLMLNPACSCDTEFQVRLSVLDANANTAEGDQFTENRACKKKKVCDPLMGEYLDTTTDASAGIGMCYSDRVCLKLTKCTHLQWLHNANEALRIDARFRSTGSLTKGIDQIMFKNDNVCKDLTVCKCGQYSSKVSYPAFEYYNRSSGSAYPQQGLHKGYSVSASYHMTSPFHPADVLRNHLYDGWAPMDRECTPMTQCNLITEYETKSPEFILLDVSSDPSHVLYPDMYTSNVVAKPPYGHDTRGVILPKMHINDRSCNIFRDHEISLGRGAVSLTQKDGNVIQVKEQGGCLESANGEHVQYSNEETVQCQLSDAIISTNNGEDFATITDPLTWNFLRKVDGKYEPVRVSSGATPEPWMEGRFPTPVGAAGWPSKTELAQELKMFTLEGIDNVLVNSDKHSNYSHFRHDRSTPNQAASTQKVFTTVSHMKSKSDGPKCHDWISEAGWGAQSTISDYLKPDPAEWVDDYGNTCDDYQNNKDLCQQDASSSSREATVPGGILNNKRASYSPSATPIRLEVNYAWGKEGAVSAADACCACGGGLAAEVGAMEQFAIKRINNAAPDVRSEYDVLCDTNFTHPQAGKHQCKRASNVLSDAETAKRTELLRETNPESRGIASDDAIHGVPAGAYRLVASTFAGDPETFRKAMRCDDDKLADCAAIKSTMVSNAASSADQKKWTDSSGTAYKYIVASDYPYPGNHETIQPYVAGVMMVTGFDKANYQSCYEAQKVDSCVFDVYVVDQEAPVVTCSVQAGGKKYHGGEGICNDEAHGHALVNITDYFSIAVTDNVDGKNNKGTAPPVLMQHVSYQQHSSSYSYTNHVMKTAFTQTDEPSLTQSFHEMHNLNTFQPTAATPRVHVSIGHHMLRFVATDSFENVGTVECELKVEDCEPPKIQGCGTNHTVEAQHNKCYGHKKGLTATATDNSRIKPRVEMSIGGSPVDDDYKFPIGRTDVLVTATDMSGAKSQTNQALQTQCYVHVVVVDKQKPDVVCPAPSSASKLGGSWNPSNTSNVTAVGVQDNSGCPVTKITLVDEEGNVVNKDYKFLVGESKTLSLKMTDCYNNTRMCQIYTTVPGVWKQQVDFEYPTHDCLCSKTGTGCSVDTPNICFVKKNGATRERHAVVNALFPSCVDCVHGKDTFPYRLSKDDEYSLTWDPNALVPIEATGEYDGDKQDSDCDAVGITSHMDNKLTPTKSNVFDNEGHFYQFEDPDGTMEVQLHRMTLPKNSNPWFFAMVAWENCPPSSCHVFIKAKYSVATTYDERIKNASMTTHSEIVLFNSSDMSMGTYKGLAGSGQQGREWSRFQYAIPHNFSSFQVTVGVSASKIGIRAGFDNLMVGSRGCTNPLSSNYNVNNVMEEPTGAMSCRSVPCCANKQASNFMQSCESGRPPYVPDESVCEFSFKKSYTDMQSKIGGLTSQQTSLEGKLEQIMDLLK